MGVPTSITDLSVTASSNSPSGADTVTTGTGPDDYLQALSAIIKEACATIYTASGADTITFNTTPTFAAYEAGMRFRFIAAGDNTGPATLNINSIGAKAITKNGATALASGDIQLGAAVEVVYDGTQFQLGNVGLKAGDIGVTVQAYNAYIATVAASQSEMEAGTESALRSVSPLRVAQAIAALGVGKFKITSFTRDISTASGTQAITGIGFQPDVVLFLYGVSGESPGGFGIDDGTNHYTYANGYEVTAGSFVLSGAASINLFRAVGNSYAGAVTTLGADGFTITWTKTGSPTGTATVRALCIKF